MKVISHFMRTKMYSILLTVNFDYRKRTQTCFSFSTLFVLEMLQAILRTYLPAFAK